MYAKPDFWKSSRIAPAALVASLAVFVFDSPLLAQVRPLEYNRDELVMMAVQGQIAHATLRDPPYRVTPDGDVGVYPGTGGITYNFRTGDSAQPRPPGFPQNI